MSHQGASNLKKARSCALWGLRQKEQKCMNSKNICIGKSLCSAHRMLEISSEVHLSGQNNKCNKLKYFSDIYVDT